jgi:DNA-binding transcriptional LysR family regulator
VPPDVDRQELRSEPRVAIVPETHRLADRGTVSVSELLDETFIGFHPAVDPGWAGFWRLDDHRSEPASRVTADRPLTPTEMVALIAARRAIATLPACHVATIVKILPGVVAIPVRDARPAVLSLVWRRDNQNPFVLALIDVARALPKAA